MTITRVGSNPKYAEGWDRAFGARSKANSKKVAKEKAPTATKAKKKTAKTAKK